MAYEYKDVIEKALIESFVHVEGAAFDELDEVYRKAKAWDKYIADVRERVKITVNTDDDVEKETQEVINYYMEDE